MFSEVPDGTVKHALGSTTTTRATRGAIIGPHHDWRRMPVVVVTTVWASTPSSITRRTSPACGGCAVSARIEPAPHFECRELGVVVNQAGDQSARLWRFLEADLMTGHCTRKHCC
jgi:hypothetical protein